MFKIKLEFEVRFVAKSGQKIPNGNEDIPLSLAGPFQIADKAKEIFTSFD